MTKGMMTIVTAEKLLQGHREYLGLEKTLKCRIRQLSEACDAEEVIASIGVRGSELDGLPRTRAAMSKTEWTTLSYEETYQEEQSEIKRCIQELKKELAKVQYYRQLHEAVMEGLTDCERWIINEYYDEGNSVETIQQKLEQQQVYISKSSLRRKKIRIVEKVQRMMNLMEQNMPVITKNK